MLFFRRIITPMIKMKYKIKNLSSLKDSTKSSQTIMDIPHPLSLPGVGTRFNFLISGSSATLHEYIHDSHAKLGPIFYDNLGGQSKLVFISEPQLMKSLFLNLEGKYPMHILPDPWTLYEKLYGAKRGLLFMNGNEWLMNRRILNKHLLRNDAEKWLEVPVKETVNKFVRQWKTKAAQQAFAPDLESEFYRLSVNVIINILIGTESSLKVSNHYEELLEKFSDTVKKIFQTTNCLYSFPVHLCERLNLKVWNDFKKSVDMSLFLGQKIVDEMLKRRHESNGLIKKLASEDMHDQTIRRIVTDLVIAAGDTTAYTTMWILYLLSKNKEVADEIALTNDISKHVVKETMRLYPVAPFLTRILTKECVLGQYKLKDGVNSSIFKDKMKFCKLFTRLSDKSVFINTRPFCALIPGNYYIKYERTTLFTTKPKVVSSQECNIRYLSVDGLMKWPEQTYTSISNSNVVHFLQDSLINFHDITGMSWWLTIVTSTVIARALMTLPLTVYQNYILAKVEIIGLELKDMVDELKKETSIAKKTYGLTDKQAMLLYKRSLKKQWRNLIVRDNCHPFKASLVIWIQIPVWVCMSFALRNLVYMNPPDATALIAFMELSVGGLGWIPNLTEPDHSRILPVGFGVTNLAIIEIQRMSKLRKPSKMYNVFTNIFRVFSVVMIPVAANVPSCMCLYWVTSSSFGLMQNLILLSPSVKRKLKIPEVPSELEEPYKHIKEEIQNKYQRLVPKRT